MLKIIYPLPIILLMACSPADRCQSAKEDALKDSEKYFISIMRGQRGSYVDGQREALESVNEVRKACGLEKYEISDLLAEAEMTSTGFVLKKK